MRFEHRFRSFTAVDTHQGNDYHTYKETTREQQFTTVRADKYFIRRVLLFVIVVIIIIIIFFFFFFFFFLRNTTDEISLTDKLPS